MALTTHSAHLCVRDHLSTIKVFCPDDNDSGGEVVCSIDLHTVLCGVNFALALTAGKPGVGERERLFLLYTTADSLTRLTGCDCDTH